MKREQPDSRLHIAHDDETEKLREWWKRNGTGIIAGVLIGIGGVGGIQGWRMYQDSQAGKASALYEQMLGAAAGEATDSAASAASALVSDHGDSGYADIARLMLARLALEAGDSVEAERARLVDRQPAQLPRGLELARLLARHERVRVDVFDARPLGRLAEMETATERRRRLGE